MTLIDKLRDGAILLKKEYLVDMPLLFAAANRIEELEQEVEVLRDYGNKDCTSMADERLEELKQLNVNKDEKHG